MMHGLLWITGSCLYQLPEDWGEEVVLENLWEKLTLVFFKYVKSILYKKVQVITTYTVQLIENPELHERRHAGAKPP